MNRGSKGRTYRSSISTISFNEAPIHESGKSSLLRSTAFMYASFNEAPIHESGKYRQQS